MTTVGRIIQGFFILIGIILISCSEEDSKPFKSGKQAKLNIATAAGIVVFDASSNNGGRIASETTNLYKITVNGSIEKVRPIYEDYTEIDSSALDTRIQVDRIYDVNHHYFILDGDFLLWDTLGNYVQYNSLLVRKTDGAIFEFRHPSHYGSDIGQADGLEDATFCSDNTGNFYYLNIEQKILKVDVSNPSQPFMIDYLPSGQTTTRYAIDGEGNCIYRNDYSGELRLRKRTGGIYEIPTEGDLSDFWIGANGKTYFTTWGNSPTSIYQLAFDTSNGPSVSLIWESQLNSIAGGVYDNSNHFKIRKENSVVFVGINGYKHWEFLEESNSVVEFELPELNEKTKIVYSNNYYYIATGTSLYKVSLENHTYSNIILPGQYEVYSMSVNNDEVLQIGALRFSDGKKIVAEINAQNAFTLIDEEQDKDVMYLQRLY